jgi:hypothetical protein
VLDRRRFAEGGVSMEDSLNLRIFFFAVLYSQTFQSVISINKTLRKHLYSRLPSPIIDPWHTSWEWVA